MPRYFYKAKKGPGEIVEGEVEADNYNAAVYKINRQGYFLLTMKESYPGLKQKGFSFRRKDKVRQKDLVIFLRQLSGLLDSGLTLFAALNIVKGQTENLFLKKVIEDICDLVKEGKTFSDSLARYPKVFPGVYASMIHAGEVSGSLNVVLSRLADFSEKEEDLKSRIQIALVYPALIFTVGIAAIAILLIFVMPRLVEMFQDFGQDLPLPTRIVISLSNFASGYWWLIALVLGMAIFMFKKKISTQEGKAAFDAFKLRIVVLGDLIKKVEIERFARTLGILLKNGVSIVRAVEVVSEVLSNEVLKAEMKKIKDKISGGSSLSKEIGKSSIFPAYVTNFIAIGEESRVLENALLKISDYYEKEIDRALKVFISLLEPVFILIMGVIVSFIVISMLLPIFQINVMMG